MCDSIWIKDPLAILAENSQRGVVVRDSRIVECVPAGREPQEPVTWVFDAARHVLIPGLINTHHHFYQTLTRSFGPSLDKELFDWLKTLYPVWKGLTSDRLRLATRVAMAELLLSGCTTTVDHHYVFPAGLEHAIDLQAEEARGLGMRVMLTRGAMDLSVADGGLPPVEVVQSTDAILADCERVVQRYHDPGPGAMVQIALAPCSPFSVSRRLMEESRQLAERLDVRLHTHLAETRDETDYCSSIHGCRPLEYLDRLGWVNSRVWLAHGIWFEDEEVAHLGQAGVGIAHCPASNMILASGFCRTRDLEDAGCPLGLAVDGAASNDASNMMQEVRQAFLLNRVSPHRFRIGHEDVLRWATVGSARCLGRDDIGRIMPGQEADLAMFTLDEFRFSGAGDPLAALVICGAHQADRVMVAGKWVVEDGTIPGFDLAALRRAHQAAAREIQLSR